MCVQECLDRETRFFSSILQVRSELGTRHIFGITPSAALRPLSGWRWRKTDAKSSNKYDICDEKQRKEKKSRPFLYFKSSNTVCVMLRTMESHHLLSQHYRTMHHALHPLRLWTNCAVPQIWARTNSAWKACIVLVLKKEKLSFAFVF